MNIKQLMKAVYEEKDVDRESKLISIMFDQLQKEQQKAIDELPLVPIFDEEDYDGAG